MRFSFSNFYQVHRTGNEALKNPSARVIESGLLLDDMLCRGSPYGVHLPTDLFLVWDYARPFSFIPVERAYFFPFLSVEY